MTTTTAPRRIWFPLLMILGTVACWAGLYAAPADAIQRDYRMVGLVLAGMIGWLGIAFWCLFLSGYARGTALILTSLILAGPIGLRYALIAEMHFDGDVMMMPRFRWQPSPETKLAAHRSTATPAIGFQSPGSLAAEDFPEYRNVRRDGVVTGPALNRDWTKSPPKPLWKQPCGGGYAGFAVAGDALVTIDQRGKDEVVVCYQASTGQEVWTHAYPALFSETLGGDGPRSTPTIAGDVVYALGATGKLVCLNLSDGRRIWEVETLVGNANLLWGMCGSPLVFDQVVVVNPGAQSESAKGRALQALDRMTGKPIWQSGDTKAGYSSPMLAEIGGTRQILLFDGEEIAGYDAAEGRKLWSHPWRTNQDINVAQPVVVDGSRVFVSSAYGVGCAMLKVTQSDGKWTVHEQWRNRKMRCKFSSPVMFNGHLYGLDEGILVCLDVETGAQIWKGQRFGHGQLLRSGDLLVILAETGKLALVEATPKQFTQLGSIPVFADPKCWNCFALSRGKVYLRNHLEMAAFDLTSP